VDWCQKHITSRFSNFQFQHIDVYSSRYNPSGRYETQQYKFPFVADSFDFAVLASVFTHMFAEGVASYLAEIARLLKPMSGRSLISYFLLNQETTKTLAANPDALHFPVKHGVYSVKSQAQPEDAVAFEEDYIRDLYRANGLEIVQIYYGSWCGRKTFLSYQDLILARKR
jgi:SAM-dependent methyltransferase